MTQKQEKHKVDSDLLFRFFNNDATQEEETAICDWLEESDEHKETYNNARELHEAFLLQAPMELFNGDIPEATKKKRNARRTMWMTVGNAAAAILFCFISFYVINEKFEDRLANTMNTITVPAGKSMNYTLSDGTVIKLNSGARLQYPMIFAKNHRTVSLDGEAYFDVIHNGDKPFIVKTFAADITVLGTNFDVYADENGNEFSTTLIEGKVKVTSKSNPWETVTLAPGHKVSMKNGNMVVEDADVPDVLLWTNGILDITGSDFMKLVKRMENAYGVKIIIERADIPEIECIGGKVRISDGIEHALSVLSQLSDFQYINDRQNGVIYIR